MNGPSPEAARLAARLAADLPGTAQISAIRASLSAEFGPRAERAKARFQPRIEDQTVAGLRSMVISPTKPTTDQVMLYLFGGGYVSGAPEFDLPITAHLSAACGVSVIAPEYPLAPEHPFPTALDAVFEVYRSLSERGVILCGESAGGGLALDLLERIERAGLTPPSALCLFSPWADPGDEASRRAETMDDPSLTADLLRFYASAYGAPQSRGPRAALPPTFATTGTRDIMLPMLRDLAEASPAIELRVWPGLWHVFELYDEIPEAALSLDQAARFISQAAIR